VRRAQANRLSNVPLDPALARRSSAVPEVWRADAEFFRIPEEALVEVAIVDPVALLVPLEVAAVEVLEAVEGLETGAAG
jgi:hypothetical protein